MSDDDIDALKAFGLSTYEANAWHLLLLAGPTDASTVATKGNIPFGRVYDVLNALADKGLVALEDARPKRYRAVPPRAALPALLRQRRHELDDKYAELTRLASDVERRFTPRPRGRDAASSFYHVSVGESESRAFLVEKVGEAKREILVNLEFKRYDPADETLFAAYEAAVARGVRVRVLVRDADIPTIIESPYNALITRTMLPHLGKALDVRVLEGEQVPFGVIDGEKALIGIRNPLDPAAYFGLVFVWEPKTAAELASRFEQLWQDADDELAEIARAANRER
ncbi:MAG: TrmB family transcriptional regulator [Thermoplasmatota archaeon]